MLGNMEFLITTRNNIITVIITDQRNMRAFIVVVVVVVRTRTSEYNNVGAWDRRIQTHMDYLTD